MFQGVVASRGPAILMDAGEECLARRDALVRGGKCGYVDRRSCQNNVICSYGSWFRSSASIQPDGP